MTNYVTKEIEDLVSIIVPIYNVEDYLEQCIVSLTEQSYQNIEIILLNDGSPDCSESICLNWKNKDKRIVYISKRNEGLGPTRTLGIRIARGKYIMFVDSDDWVEKDYVRSLYESVKKYDADLGFCDRTDWYGNESKKIICNLEISNTTCFKDDPVILYSISPGMWNKIYARKLFTENELVIPPYESEEFCTLPAILYHAKKITQVRECLYNYRREREGSIVDVGDGMCKAFPFVVRHSCEYMKENGIWDEIKVFLEKHLTKQFFFIFYESGSKMKLKKSVTNEYLEDAYAAINKYFPQWKNPALSHNRDYILLGSPNLRSLIDPLDMAASFFSGYYMKRFNFSSLISIFASDMIYEDEIVLEENPYRQEMCRKENKKEFLPVLMQTKKNDLFLFDLLEERFDIWEYNGGYRTLNPMNKKLYEEKQVGRRIPRDSDEVKDLWSKTVERFISFVKEHRPKTIVMYENHVNASMRDYGSEVSTEKMNRILDGYYRDIERLLPEVLVLHHKKDIMALQGS